jgi:hypothetical protein
MRTGAARLVTNSVSSIEPSSNCWPLRCERNYNATALSDNAGSGCIIGSSGASNFGVVKAQSRSSGRVYARAHGRCS